MPWKPGEAIVVFLLAWMGAPIAIIYLIKSLAPFSSALQGFLASFKAGDITSSFVFTAVSAMASLAVVGYYLHKHNVGWRSVGWKEFDWRRAALYVLVAIGLFLVTVNVVFVVVEWLFPGFNATQAQVNEFTHPANSAARRMSLMALVVLPPIVEETVFRGFIFPALSKWQGAVAGAVITSLLFGLAHLQFNVSLYTVILSLILCFMYYRLRSIWPGVILHMINNYIAFASMIHK